MLHASSFKMDINTDPACSSITKTIYLLLKALLVKNLFNPLTPRSDQYINSSNNFNTLSSKQVMRIKRIINYGVLFGYNTKFSGLGNKEMYGHQLGELHVAFRSW